MRGKTPQEVAQMAGWAFDQIRAGQAQPAQPQPQPQYAASAQGTQTPPDPNLAYTDPAAYQRQLIDYQTALIDARMQSFAAPIVESNAETARQLSRGGKYADVWRRWEPEIERKLAGIPASMRNLALYEQAAALVKSDHIDEIAREAAEKLSSQGMGTERTHGASAQTSSSGDALDAFWSSNHPYVQTATSHGVTKDVVRANISKLQMTVDDWVNAAKDGEILNSKHGWERRMA